MEIKEITLEAKAIMEGISGRIGEMYQDSSNRNYTIRGSKKIRKGNFLGAYSFLADYEGSNEIIEIQAREHLEDKLIKEK
jgi:hypothetical protein